MDNIINLLQREVRPALGCTEPAAVALACAYAAYGVEGEIDEVRVFVDPNVYKNGMGVFVPGADAVGLPIAAALGALIADPVLELQVLGAVKPGMRERACRLISEGRVTVEPVGEFGQLRIAATVRSGGCESTAEISGTHTHLSALFRNGKQTFTAPVQETSLGVLSWLKDYTVKDIVRAVQGRGKELTFLVALAQQNMKVAQAGLSEPMGVGLGWNLRRLMEEGKLGTDGPNRIMSYVAAAADARMSGYSEPVISTNGSGNQGITASLPVLLAYEDMQDISEDRLTEALAISHLITIYVKQYIGKLSASCACAMAAAIGASCGISYLWGQSDEQLENCIGLMAANLTGMICDGAKVSCSFKLATAALTAVQSAMLAGVGVSAPAYDGILSFSAEQTIFNLGEVSNPGMRETDRVILNLMCAKKKTS
ncbi:MAG: L-serine ammonia-lyase, iron-sulfur-dependent, subunit alpha [Bacillota bacterium]|nr:L-serine ammonia-lyase, iron-sulfur-dependent, subunit alpha [Bacillota bacterium]